MKRTHLRVLVPVAVAAGTVSLAACWPPGGPAPGPLPPVNTIDEPCDDCHGDEPGEPGYPGDTVAPNS
jgi:hypothetical protein